MGNWAINFMLSIMIIILLQYLSPEGKFDKHIKLVSSLILSIAVFIPAVEMIRKGDFNEAYLKTSLYVDSVQVQFSSERAEDLYKQTLLSDYKANLAQSVLTQLKKGVSEEFEAKVTVEVNEDEESDAFASIQKISLHCPKEYNMIQIKKVINNFYNVPDENIYITVEKQEE